MRLLIRFSSLCLLCFGLMTIVAVAAGSTQPVLPALVGFDTDCQDQTQPCWYGIVLGETGLGAATKQLDKLGYFAGLGSSSYALRYTSPDRSPGCVELYFDHAVVHVISIVLGCMNVRTGDLSALLGDPAYQEWYTERTVEWINGRVIIRMAQPWTQSAFDVVQYVRLVHAPGSTAQSGSIAPWRGFLPRWRYCQFEHEYAGCQP